MSHKIRLIGSSTKLPSIATNQEASDYKPRYFEWDHGEEVDPERTVFFDGCLIRANFHDSKMKIGIILEPYGLRPWFYQSVVEARSEFAAIFTHNTEYASLGDPFHFYPHGGHYIKEWGMFEKSKLVSLIVGNKTQMIGHQMRHETMTKYGEIVDLYGYPYPFNPKHIALRPYQYSVVIESSKVDAYFTEKLIDCFSQGTIPIYWGCPSIGNFFDARGIIQFDDIKELGRILKTINQYDYSSRLPYIKDNLLRAQTYKCPEDWLYEHYPKIFGELDG